MLYDDDDADDDDDDGQSCRVDIVTRGLAYNKRMLRADNRHFTSTSSIETHLVVVRGLPTKKFLPKCVNKKSSLERRYFA